MAKSYKTFSEIKDNKTLCDSIITVYNYGRKYGLTQKEVAERYGVSKYTVRKVFDENERAIYSKRVNDEDLKIIIKQYQSGMQIYSKENWQNSIAGYHGLSESTIKKYININKKTGGSRLTESSPIIQTETSQQTPALRRKEEDETPTHRDGGDDLEGKVVWKGQREENRNRIFSNAGYSIIRTLATAAVAFGLFVGGLALGVKSNNHKAYNQGNKAGYSLGYKTGYENCIQKGKCHEHKTQAQHVQKQNVKQACHPTHIQAQNAQKQKADLEKTAKSAPEINQAEQSKIISVKSKRPIIIIPKQTESLDDILSICCKPVKKVTAENKTLGWYVGNVFFNSSSIKDANAEYTNRKFNDVKLIAEGMERIFGDKAVIDRYELDGLVVYNLPKNEQGETGYLSIMPIRGAELNATRHLNDVRLTNVHLKGFTDITQAGIKTSKITSAQFGGEISSEKGKGILHRMDQPNTNMIADVYGMQTKKEVRDGPADLGPYTVYFGQNANFFCSSDVNKAAGIGVLEGLLLFGGITQINDGGVLSNLGSWTEGPVGVGVAAIAP